MENMAMGSVEHWAREAPDASAIIDGDQALSWRTLDALANRLAQGLAEHGVQRGDIVVVRTLVRWEWVVIASALGKLGCSLLGLNWRLTASEVRHVLQDSGATALICDDAEPLALAEAFPGLGIRLAVSIDAPAASFVPFADLLRAEPVPREAHGDPPLIIYTSGTTGLPKGVVSAQSSDSQRLREYREDVMRSRVGDLGSVTLVCMPMHHASGPSQVWGSMKRGALTVLLRRFTPEGALDAIERHRVTSWGTVPTMLKRLEVLDPAILARYDVSSVRKLTVGAAPVSHATKLWTMDHFGECLQEGYGSTEVSMVTVLEPHMQRAKPGSSGRPYRHVQIEIRDAQGRVLAPGQTGDIWVSTPATISGYLNAPPLAADTLDSRGFFRVGDVGHLDADGYLYITDRAKDMIISGGVNVYPAEIEAVLLRHPAVLDAAVVGVPDPDFGERILAFCELRPMAHALPQALLDACRGQLASYKLPRELHILDELPRNTMGKILKKDLRKPYWSAEERQI